MNKITTMCFVLALLGGCGEVVTESADSDTEIVTETPVADGTDKTSVDSDALWSGEVSPSTGTETEIQAGTLTSGDYDDLLNPALYSDYITSILQGSEEFSEFPTFDITNAIKLSVVDMDDKPFGGATISIQSGDTGYSLSTPSAGWVHLYPALDSLSDTVDITVTYDTYSVSKTIKISELGDQRTVDFKIEDFANSPSMLDLMVVIDTTGSMGDELAYLKVELASILNELSVSLGGIDLNLGLVMYRDDGDLYVTRVFDLSSDVDQILDDLSEQNYDGGGDYPEAMERGIGEALQQQWRGQATKMMLLVADAPPHDEALITTWELGQQAREQQIHIIPIAASGVALKAEFVMRGLAALTHSRYIFLTDDSGVGGTHEEPTADCYVVTRLDSNIRRVILDLFTGVRTEPTENEIVRTKGNYQNGICGE
ncbi:VWA domain-containing protein [Psychrosphaera sp. 1_MG-2023]|uniref:vWA domain-containing protein n=1 Tax=Psychrosphaera sp. 1_MG-2023 TaxID=3062643 RepID=UPI0026E1C6A1|nr:vWA domain-containing protein [Psychrosphaera sp. 1_MG-2023]MDO6720495.1 VWA domain-containing protein [Psychrosphaera sp. 1_MG-2023]